ncbi:MAG: tetratricopeptide repeat protein [Thermoguttaceae bacterium]|jgi:tetratricopeptide (TPR) repeat protein
MTNRLLSFCLTGFTFLSTCSVTYGINPMQSPVPEQAGSAMISGDDARSAASYTAVASLSEVGSQTGEEGLLAQAERYYQLKRFFEAEKIYNQYVSQNAQLGVSSDLALAYHRLGLIAKKRQLYNKAQEYLIMAIKSDPTKNPQITLDHAIILYDIGEYKRAKNFFEFLNERYPNLEEAKIYLGKTLLEVDPGIEVLPLLEAEMGRIEAGELLAARCREVGKVEDAEKIEEMFFNEKVKADQIFFSSAESAIPLPDKAVVDVPQRHAPRNAEIVSQDTHISSRKSEALAAIMCLEVPENNKEDGFMAFPGFDGANMLNDSILATPAAVSPIDSSFAAAQGVAEALARKEPTERNFVVEKPNSSQSPVFGGYPGLAMNDDDGKTIEPRDNTYANSLSIDGKASGLYIPVDKMSEFEGVSDTSEEDYAGFDGYLPPSIPRSKQIGVPILNTANASSLDSAPIPDFTFVSDLCSTKPEKIALEVVAPSAPTSSEVSQKNRSRRLSSEEKLQIAEQAGAKITYLTPEEYNHEIATRAGKVVRHAEEKILKSNLEENQKQELFQKIFGK